MPPTRHLRAALAVACLTLASVLPAAAAVTPNGRLQIYHLDVGQGDGALLITPLGQVVMIDNGYGGTPAMGRTVTQQLQDLGVTHVDHHFASHYHADHIGSMNAIAAAGITFGYGWDRAGSYTTATYTNYVNVLGAKRRTIVKGQVITLDSLSAHPVTIKCVDLAGMGLSTTDENSLCMMLKVTYGEFDETFGGDLPYSSLNVEGQVVPQIGTAEVYKVHHHGSATSSSAALLAAIQAKLGVISCGNGNSYGHPTASALTRLHAANMKTYWTETGAGVAPNAAWDKVSNGQVVISATWQPGGVDTIRGNGFADTFTNSGTGDLTAPVVNLTAPDGGEVWKVGSAHPITWSASDNIAVASVDLAWSPDGGSTWTPIASGIANAGSYAWTVPVPGSPTARVRVLARDAAGNLAADSSIATATFDYWTVTASAGTGGTITPAGVVNVSQGGASGYAIAAASGFQILDVLVDGGSLGAVTAYTFNAVAAHHTIAASFLDVTAPLVAITSPVGGEQWDPASTHDITWTASDNLAVDSVTVEYSMHGVLGPWQTLAHGLANSGSWSWTLPTLVSDSALVRVVAYDGAHLSGSDASDSLFAIGSGALAVGDERPGALALARPTPNPSAGPTRLAFTLPHEARVSVEILDLAGRRVWRNESWMPAGTHAWTWDGRGDDGSSLGAGLYFVRLSTPFGGRTDRIARLR
jgi:beta-lactamase superfamily II metal-dependent hydrolase